MPNAQYQQGPPHSNPQSKKHFEKGSSENQQAVQISGKTLADWKPEIQNWIKNGINKQTVVYAEGMGKKLKEEGLTTSQIRNVFGEMRKIQMNGFEKEVPNFLLLRPKLAYAAKRQSAKGMDAFYELFCIAYDAVEPEDKLKAATQFDQLLQVMEAVLAYHKFHGGQ
jgi:CRISPR-associated protein Csm2